MPSRQGRVANAQIVGRFPPNMNFFTGERIRGAFQGTRNNQESWIHSYPQALSAVASGNVHREPGDPLIRFPIVFLLLSANLASLRLKQLTAGRHRLGSRSSP